MKKLLSIHYSDTAFNISFFLLRVILGISLCVNYGYDKLIHFADYKDKFVNLFGIGSTATLALVVFAEFFCSVFAAIGLFTRFTVLPVVITLGYAFFKSNNADLFGDGKIASLYLTGFIVLLLCGPGKYSVDGMIHK
jgi:putative oxidoreductase